MQVTVDKGLRRLLLLDGQQVLLNARVALGRQPVGPKRQEGDGRTPEGRYRICLEKEQGKYGLSLGLNYPNAQDAETAYSEGALSEEARCAIQAAIREGRRPPWGTALGGEIYLHEGPTDHDWTQGCIALQPADMAVLWAHRNEIGDVDIRP